MSTLRISNIEAKSVPASATIDEKVKITNSSGDPLVFIDGKTSGITTVGINTTDANITFDANSNVVVTGIITATRFSGQITPTSLEIGSNIKLGNAGVITATSFVGSGANLTSLPSQVTISNNADNRVITGGSGVNLNGESNLTFDGSTLGVTGDFTLTNSNHVTQVLKAGGSTSDLAIDFKDSSNNLEAKIFCASDQGDLRFYTGGANERLRITSSGEMGVNTTAPVEKLGISGNMRFVNPNGTTSRITALSSGTYSTGTSGGSAICFQRTADGGGGSDEIFFETHWQGNRHGESCRINKYGNLKFPSGQGIDFSATANAGSPSNTSSELFDDYEEGSWVPGLSGSSSVTGQTYTARSGYYTKIGNRVFCDFSIVIGTSGSYGGTYIQIVNLPFTINSGAYTRSCSTPIYFRTLNYRWCFLGLQQHEGQTKCYIFGVEGPGSGTDGASNRSYPNGGDIANGTEMTASFSYLSA